MKILGIDIGGSALKGAPVDLATGRLLGARFRIETPKVLTPAALAKHAAEMAQHFKWRGPIGVGFPGVIHGSHILTSANLHRKFIGCDGGKLFAQATKCPVTLTNDAAAAALAEMRFGAGRNFKGKTLLLTLGTGIGSSLCYHGLVVPCEFGHLQIKGKSAERFVSAAARKRRDLSWAKWGKELGEYIRSLEQILWPELIIIGGGVSAKSRKFFPYLKTRAKVVPAKFLNEAGIVGAALSFNRHG
ncbi:MAG: polyphosphate glucokinase [Verrucomicrobia bacterium]|jgi:polyphosphate glucokinase|nr:MAG: polyphosphate glucokinase [Verrucomicrobiota bacterium]